LGYGNTHDRETLSLFQKKVKGIPALRRLLSAAPDARKAGLNVSIGPEFQVKTGFRRRITSGISLLNQNTGNKFPSKQEKLNRFSVAMG
jgi:hypothetical protein